MFGPTPSVPVVPSRVVVVLGIDPGLTRCGYGVVRREGSDVRATAAGVVRTQPNDPIPSRLAELLSGFVDLVDEVRPDVVAVERLFFQVNARTAMSVGQASGLVLAVAARAGCDVVQYTPNEVKQAVAGHGGAPKEQVARMVQSLLGLPVPPRPADAADALALALCHLARMPFLERVAAAGGAARSGGPIP